MSYETEREGAKLTAPVKNEHEIIRKCQAGDLRAFEIIYRHFEQPLLNMGLRMLGKQEDAEDAIQTTFLRLYRSIGKFTFKAKLSTYLFRIMMNVCFDQLKKRKHDGEPEERHYAAYSSPVELRLQLEDGITRLPERMRACFVLFAIQDMKQDEIARILNMKLGTVKANIFQAKARLRSLLSDTHSEVN